MPTKRALPTWYKQLPIPVLKLTACALGVRMVLCGPALKSCQPGRLVLSLADVCPTWGN